MRISDWSSDVCSSDLAALKGQETWVLIGGPPCQAYSLAGRSRRANDKDFHKDEKHFLYRDYLRIIQVHKPTIFVMENVTGLLSSKHSGDPMFEKIIADRSEEHTSELHSLMRISYAVFCLKKNKTSSIHL